MLGSAEADAEEECPAKIQPGVRQNHLCPSTRRPATRTDQSSVLDRGAAETRADQIHRRDRVGASSSLKSLDLRTSGGMGTLDGKLLDCPVGGIFSNGGMAASRYSLADPE